MEYSDWFCLVDGRDNLVPHVENDSDRIFCHKGIIKNSILDRIENSFIVKKPPKMVVYGDWGVGKTHALNHIKWWLEKSEHLATTYCVELGDVKKKSKFNLLLRPLLEQVTLDKLVVLLDGFRQKSLDPVVEFAKAGARPGVAEAFRRFNLIAPGQTPTEEVRNAFLHIQGEKAPGYSQPLTESEEHYSVLLCIGELFKRVENKLVIFIADEIAKVQEVDLDGESTLHWISINKQIFDNNNNSFGFIYSLNGQEDDLPDILYHPQLQNRLTEEGYVQFRNLVPDEVDEFLKNLSKGFVNQDKVKLLKEKGDLPSDYDLSHYPFYDDARANFLEYWERTSDDAKPRDIAEKLESLAVHAMKKNSRLIKAEYLTELNM